MADAVCARCGTFALDNVILAKDFLRRAYSMVWDSYLWPKSAVAAYVTSDGEQIVLPAVFGQAIAVRSADNYNLGPTEISLYFQITPTIFEQTGIPLTFTELAPCAVSVLPPGREKLQLVSSSASDIGNVAIRGESSGAEVNETVTLTGTTPVTTANLYDVPLTVAKGITVGALTVVGYTSTTALLVLPANEGERKHVRLWVHPANPGISSTVMVLGKRKIVPLLTDEDTPLLPNISQILIDAACADMFSKLGKPAESAESQKKAGEALKVLIDLETRQAARHRRVVPVVTDRGWYGDDMDWMRSSRHRAVVQWEAHQWKASIYRNQGVSRWEAGWRQPRSPLM